MKRLKIIVVSIFTIMLALMVFVILPAIVMGCQGSKDEMAKYYDRMFRHEVIYEAKVNHKICRPITPTTRIVFSNYDHSKSLVKVYCGNSSAVYFYECKLTHNGEPKCEERPNG